MRAALLALLLTASAASELHIVSHVPKEVQVLWLPGPDAWGHGSGSLAAATPEPSSLVISTYAGHSFQFAATDARSELVTHSGAEHDLVILSPTLTLRHVVGDELQRLVRDVYPKCQRRDGGYLKCCQDLLAAQGIPPIFTDIYVNTYAPHRLMPRVAGRGAFSDAQHKLGQDLEDDSYGGALPPDEMVLLNNMQVPVELHWAYASDASDLASKKMLHDTILVTDVAPKSFVRITGHPGQIFLGKLPSERDVPSTTSPFRYPGELFVARIDDEAAPKVTSWDQDELKILLSGFAQKCGDLSNVEEAFLECFKREATFPPVLSVLWFQLLWASLQHWRICVHLPDTASKRQVDLVLDMGSKNRTLKADVLREEPLVLGITGLATPEECHELIKTQDLVPSDLGMAWISGGTQSKSRRTLTRNLYPEMEEPGTILERLHKRFFQAARGASGYDLWPDGQEPVNWLHYKPGFEYRPHCDGGCGMDPVPSGKRVASSLLYCQVAEQGGSTIFTQDAIKFSPAQGDFLFFAYKSDPNWMSMHAACPVLRGAKSTATQWYREGVSKDYTWQDVGDMGQRRTSEL